MHGQDVAQDDLHEALDLGLPEMVDDGAVVVIEWGDAVAPVLPADLLELRISFPEGLDSTDDERRWHIRPVGRQWQARADGLRDVLAPWEDVS